MLTLTDLFCGAGGSSTGAEMVPGVEVVMAVNHWRLAVATHAANHPGTAHDCADISQVDPRRYPSTDLLWASPECTNHSIARGMSRRRQAEARRADLFGPLEADPPPGEEAAVRSRATMWDVVRFAEHHAYRAIAPGRNPWPTPSNAMPRCWRRPIPCGRPPAASTGCSTTTPRSPSPAAARPCWA